jgi:hypothetical protein
MQATQVDAQYIHEQNEKARNFEEWQNAKAEHQIIELRRAHERWMCKATNNQAEEMITYDLFCEAQRIPTECAAIERIRAKFDERKTAEDIRLDEKIALIRAKAQQRIDAEYHHRRMRCWTCADDGFAHPFEYRGRYYYRTYSGAMWHAGNAYEGNEGQLAAWAGVWNGIYIAKGIEPQEKPSVAML